MYIVHVILYKIMYILMYMYVILQIKRPQLLRKHLQSKSRLRLRNPRPHVRTLSLNQTHPPQKQRKIQPLKRPHPPPLKRPHPPPLKRPHSQKRRVTQRRVLVLLVRTGEVPPSKEKRKRRRGRCGGGGTRNHTLKV